LTLVSCKLTRTHNTAIPYNLAQEPAARAPRRILGVRRACVAASCIDAGPVRCSRSLLHTAVVAGEPGDAPGRRPFVPIDEAPRNPQRSSQVKVSSHRRAARSGSVRPHPRPRTGTIADSSCSRCCSAGWHARHQPIGPGSCCCRWVWGRVRASPC